MELHQIQTTEKKNLARGTGSGAEIMGLLEDSVKKTDNPLATKDPPST